jgi:hypothetical protein
MTPLSSASASTTLGPEGSPSSSAVESATSTADVDNTSNESESASVTSTNAVTLARQPDGNGKGALIGGIIGGILALLVVGGLIAFIVMRSRRGNGNNSDTRMRSPESNYGRIQPIAPDYTTPPPPESQYDQPWSKL